MWEGVSVDTLLARLRTNATFAVAHSYGGYSTNPPLYDLTNKQAWIAFRYGDADLAPEHGGPARLLVPHRYFWKSAKWIRSITLLDRDEPGFWESIRHCAADGDDPIAWGCAQLSTVPPAVFRAQSGERVVPR
jgi:DMSO/TMAO reductase YedYZ molybdopterin-dependent catalytic subunit